MEPYEYENALEYYVFTKKERDIVRAYRKLSERQKSMDMSNG